TPRSGSTSNAWRRRFPISARHGRRNSAPVTTRREDEMPVTLDAKEKNFNARFDAFLASKRETAEAVETAVRAIIAAVAAHGDRALVELSKNLDRTDLQKVGLKVSPSEIDSAFAAIDPKVRAALEFAKQRIEDHHRRQRPQDLLYTDALGVELGYRW